MPDAPRDPVDAPPSPDLTQQPLELDPAAAARLAAAVAAAGTASSAPLEAKCAVVERLRQALQDDAGAQAALDRIPQDARSVANAVSVWNTTWINLDGSDGGAATAAIRALFTRELQRTSVACRSEPLRGPRLITRESARGPTALAFGSGLWRWADLLD